MNRPFFDRLFLIDALAESAANPLRRWLPACDIHLDYPIPTKRIKQQGVYRCACCDLLLFTSHTRFAAGTGWASFWAPVAEKNIHIIPANGIGSDRVELTCDGCGSHLGYLFDDGPTRTRRRFSVLLAALMFYPNR